MMDGNPEPQADDTMAELKLFTLGPPRLERDGHPIDLNLRKALALLIYLTVTAQPQSRDTLATLLWPDSDQREARGRLRRTLHRLRDELGVDVVQVANDTLQLDQTAHLWFDGANFLQHAARGLAVHGGADADQIEHLRAAEALYTDDFLAGWTVAESAAFDEWQFFERERLREILAQVLERLVRSYAAQGTWEAAIPYARRWVALDPLHEAAQRELMTVYAWAGQQAAAVRQYKECVRILGAELGVAPDDETMALYDAIRFRRFPPPAEGPAARSQTGATAFPRREDHQAPLPTAAISPQADNDRTQTGVDEPAQPPFVVPAPPTPMVNRVAEVQTICTHLRDRRIRAVTITGIGGIGKTRLALEAAHALHNDFRDGVYFVGLAALKDAALVADGIAQVLGVKERPGQRVSTTLSEHIGSKHLLLVLDNFEHVVTAAPLVSDLLAACPALRVLVTSRAALNIRAEHQLRLEPLTDADAVQLFVQRAQAAGAILTTNEASITVYSAICQRLDRLPLAIELIAVRARTLAPLDLLRLLDRPLHALVRGPRDVPARHQTLRTAIRWSYDLLDAEEQHVFMSLGVFAGGFDVEAAQAVLGESIPVLPVLETLHEASLLQQQIVADQTRFLMLETIREFALEQLMTHGNAAATHDRHMQYYARFAIAADGELLRAEAPRWQARVAAEQDNLRAAFRWSMGQHEYATALRIATGVWRFYWMAGRLHEAIERLELALVYREQAPLDVQAHALRAAGTLAGGVNDFTRARQWLEAAVDVSRLRSDLLTLQPALTNLGYALVEQGELAAAQPHLEESIVLARQSSDPSVVKFPLGILAGLYQRQGKYAQAQAAAEECLRINHARHDPEGTANALRTLATIMQAQGDLLRAQALCEAALDLHRSLNHQLGIGLDYLLFGDISRAQDDDAGALTHYHHCLDLWQDGESNIHSAPVLDRIAQILGDHDDPALAVKLMATAQRIREQTNTRLAAAEHVSRDKTLLACRVTLGESAFAAAWAAGCALTLAQAIRLALARIAPQAIKTSVRERSGKKMQPFIELSPGQTRLAERPHVLDGDVIVLAH